MGLWTGQTICWPEKQGTYNGHLRQNDQMIKWTVWHYYFYITKVFKYCAYGNLAFKLFESGYSFSKLHQG